MAERFACDPQEAEVVARELTRMRSDMRASAHPLNGATGAQGSEPIGKALTEFLEAVTATRADLLASLDRVSGLFAGLSEGTLDLDKAFAERASET